MNKYELKTIQKLPIEIIDGDRGTNYPSKSEYKKKGYCLFLNTSNVTTNGFDFSSCDFIDANRDSLLRKGKVKLHDIVLTTRGTVGNVGFVKENTPYKNMRINSGMIILRCNTNSVDPYFLYSFFKSQLFKKQVKSQGSGSAQPQLPIGSLKKISIPIPDLESQRKIASVLFTLDSKIELNNHISSELEALSQTLYAYWFLQYDFPDKEGKPYRTNGGKMVWSEKLKRDIPESWEVRKIGEVAKVKAGGDKPNNYSIEKSEFNHVPIYSNGITNDGLYGFTNESIITEQSVTISARGTIGFCVLRNTPFVPIIRLISLTPNFKGSAKYFYETLKSSVFEKSGSVQQQLTVPQVAGIDILYPNDDVLKKFDDLTSPMIEKIEIVKKENQKLAELRDWLLPMLMNGQVKVD